MKLVRTTIALPLIAILCYAAACTPGMNDRSDYCEDGAGNATPTDMGYCAALQSSLVAFTSDWYNGDGNQITSRYDPKQKTKRKQKPHGFSQSGTPAYMLSNV